MKGKNLLNLIEEKENYLKLVPFVNYFINALRHDIWFSNCFIPRTFYIEVTNHCNAKCYMCPHNKMKRKKGIMPWELFTKIIDECKDFEGRGLVFILHKDGEPLLDPLLIRRIEYIKANLKNSRVTFNSNAMLLNEEMSLKILNSPIDSITFSVDGASKEQYEKIRIGLKYEVVKKNLDSFFKLKRKLNKKTPHIIMQMVVSIDNECEIDKYRDLWSNKADDVYFKAMHNFLVQKTSIKTHELMEKQLEICLQPFILMHIYWNGDVGLCCWDYDHSIDLGNVRKSSILEVFNNNKFKEVRNAMRKKSCKNISPCNICSQIYGKDMDMSYF
jgi:MoaA/NifB/PqqE/SkfB family radical SAM enzyme